MKFISRLGSIRLFATVCFLTSLIATAACGQATAGCMLENEYLRRVVDAQKGLATVAIENRTSGERIELVSAEFRILLDNGRELRSPDFEVVSSQETAALCGYRLKNAGENIEIEVSYEARPGEPWTRKRVKVLGGASVKVVEVERFRIASDQKGEKTKTSGGGGAPLYVKDMFLYAPGASDISGKEGLFAVSFNYVPEEEFVSVIGVSAGEARGGVESTYRMYSKNYCGGPQGTRTMLLLKPPPSEGASMQESHRLYYEDIMKKLGGTEYGPYAALMSRESLPLDAPIAKKFLNAEAGVALNSGVPANDVSKADAIVAGVACPSVFSRRSEELNRIIELSGKAHPREIIVRKTADCSSTGQPFDKTAVSANERDYVAEIRRIEPCASVFGDYSPALEPQTYYDALIIPDPAPDLLPPATNQRLLNITARDAGIFSAIRKNTSISPAELLGFEADVNGLSEIRGSSNGNDLADELLMRYISGGGNVLLNIDFSSMSGDDMKTVNAILRWARKNAVTLAAKNVFAGANPLDGSPYAYSHVNDDRGIVGVRNPSFLPSEYDFRIDSATGFAGKSAMYEARISYPYEANLGSKFKYGDEIHLPLEREQLVILEIAEAGRSDFVASDIQAPPASVMAGARQIRRNKSAVGIEGVYTFSAPAGVKAEFIVYAESPDKTSHDSVAFSAIINGEPGKAESLRSFGLAEGESAPSGWVMYKLPLPVGSSNVGFNISAPGSQIWGWLMTETAPAPGAPLFASWLPADRAYVSKSEIKLF